MDVPDALYYLDDRFPPRSLRRYQLKTILQQHDIAVPTSMKRAELVALFQAHILSRREEIIKEYNEKHASANDLEIPAKRTTVQTERKDKNFIPTPTSSDKKIKSSTFTTKDAFPETMTTTKTAATKKKSLPQSVVMANVTVDYNDDEDDEEYIASSSDLEYSDEEYVDDEPVDEDEVSWLKKDTAKANMTKKERALDAVQEYWSTAQTLLRGFYILAVLFIVGSAAMIVIARNKNGYCSPSNEEGGEAPVLSSSSPVSMSSSPVEKFLSLSSSCIPCPDHGVCTDGELHCAGLYKRRHALYNAFGILPVADECIQDSAIGRAVARAEKRIKSALARRQGQHVCDYVSRFGTDEGLSMVHTKASDIRQVVEDRYMSESKWSRDKLKQVLDSAFTSLAADPKVHHWEIDGEPYFGTEQAKLSMVCSVRMFFAEASPRVKRIAVGVLAGIPILSFGWYNHMWHTRVQRHTKAKVFEAISLLKEQLEKHLTDPDGIERGLPVSQLRVKLTDVNKPGSVDEWVRISQNVQSHPQVRRAFREVAGEPCEYWELSH
ncbi:Man1-Src1p-C-terminal domain-containing protein [Zychaea mexicana]|uniref:Man1-Src1p-C-terminal domain-containing protein n=1 Tax=Zychaea mexicana TaxID=64656 RepID=UPI0022FDB3DD|nr:Man1-Src1p-C-terminal domain-containing protein [Zychaea mexicana]KAI9495963.1 Man1-Src1p-C-terminal domain-containing protein [Zychaea mexicana]